MGKREKKLGKDGGKAVFEKIGKPGMRLLSLRRWHPDWFTKDGQLKKKFEAKAAA